ncbi:MATE family efflux transporter [Catenibacterium mitsuokai]
MNSDFTQGSIFKKLVAFMIPVLGALVLQAGYGAVDLLVVGHFGTTAGLSAVSTGSQVLNLVTFVITQFAMGITVLIARYIGEKKQENIGALIGGATVLFGIVSVFLFIIMILCALPISTLMQAPDQALNLTSMYVRICGGGIFFIVAYNVLSAIFRGLGDSKSPLLFVAVACLINVVGDLVLVAGFHLDAAGAAMATVLAQA